MKRKSIYFAVLVTLTLAPSIFAAQSAPDPVFQKLNTAEIKNFGILRANLKQAVGFARIHPDLFSPDKDHRNILLSRDDKMAIWTTWGGVLDSLAGLDDICRENRKFSLLQESDRRSASFAIANASFLAGYRFALEFIALADKNPALDTVLNEAVPELGLPAGTFDRFKFRFLNVVVASEFAALQVIGQSYTGGPAELKSASEEDNRVIWNMGKVKGHELTLKNALAIVQKSSFAAWFPLQKGVSGWIGNTKVARPHTHLISAKQIETMGKRLQPGDIIFERHEWFLSNLGLPGFWTHVALFIGTPEERRVFFNDPEVREWVKGLGVADGDFETLLRQRYSTAYSVSTIRKEDRHPVRILEAISEGVSFTSLEYTGSADSIGVIRPHLSKRDKAQAVLRAFHYSGRPYDFNFDFQTDATLVCSELIFKVYEPGGGMKGLRLPISEVMGRKVSTPNGMVKQFDEQTGNAAAQTGFVLFLDGFEKEKRAVESTPEQFRASWRRPNWHILIQAAPVEAKSKSGL